MIQNEKDYPLGICPFQSSAVVLPKSAVNGVLGSPGQMQLAPGVIKGDCSGAGCQLWDGTYNMCSFKVMSYFIENLKELIPPIGTKESVAPTAPKDKSPLKHN